MKVLVTGANGFIGQALCKRMLADGYQVREAVRSAAQMTALPSGVEGAMVGNIGPETDWSDVLSGIEGIVHLAARVHVMRESVAYPLAAFRLVNVAGIERLALQAADAGVKRLVYISSVKVNGERTGDGGQGAEGRGQEGELKEAFSEEDVPGPQDPYAVSKWEAEQVLRDIAADTGLEAVILRPPLVYGPGVKANFLRLLKLVDRGIPLPLANVNNCRSLVYIENLLDAVVTCITHPKAAGETFLVSDNMDLSTPEVIWLMAEAMGRKARLFPFPPIMLKTMGKIIGRSAEIDRLTGSFCVDSSKIRTMLGWNPPYTLEEGIRKTVLWYKKYGKGQRTDGRFLQVR